MIEQELDLTSLEFTPFQDEEHNQERCLIVPVASVGTDDSAVLHRIWELASRSGAVVRFVGICPEKAREGELRRSLVTMAAVLHSGGVTARVDMLTGRDWSSRLRSSLGSEDTLICQNEASRGFLHPSLLRQLQTELDASFYILSSPMASLAATPHWLVRTAAWAGSAAILAGFFIFQFKISLLGGNLATVLEALSAVVEVVAICAWNAWLG